MSNLIRDRRPFPPTPDDVAALTSKIIGQFAPTTPLASTGGFDRSLREIGLPRAILYVYPRTSSPSEPAPADWDLIPGAKGCTAESCNFRDFRSEFSAAGYDVFGLSAQSTSFQREAHARLHLNFELLADPLLSLADRLDLPTFEAGNLTLYRRITLVLDAGRISKIFYPILEPETHPQDVLRWIAEQELSAHSTREQ